MNLPLLAAEPSSPTSPYRGMTLRQQRISFARVSQAAPLESDDGGINSDDMQKRHGSATSTMEWRPLSMEQVRFTGLPVSSQTSCVAGGQSYAALPFR